MKYSKTCLKPNLKGPEHFFAKARFPFNQGTLPVEKLTQDMHVFETKQNAILVNVFTVESVNTRKHYTEQKKKLKFSLFLYFFQWSSRVFCTQFTLLAA